MNIDPQQELSQEQDKLRQILRDMSFATEGNEYYALTLKATAEGKIIWEAKTGFKGVTDTKPQRELRGPCLVRGQVMLDLWRDVGTPGVAVDDTQQMAVFLHLGGNAIVEASLAEKYFADILEPKVVVPTGLSTSTWIENIDETALHRAPTRKLRMRILKRDNYRCRICGRRPETNVDIELHVHHFRPWGLGGLTIEENLITLCHTCHDGLDPHFDMSVANLFPETFKHLNELLNNLDAIPREYFEGVKRYREKVREIRTSKQDDEE